MPDPSPFDEQFHALLHTWLRIASDRRNILRDDAVSYVEAPGWAPPATDPPTGSIDDPTSWVQVERLMAHTSGQVYQPTWESPLRFGISVREVRTDTGPLCLRVFSTEFDLGGYYPPAVVERAVPAYLDLLTPLCGPIFPDYKGLGWRLDVGKPVTRLAGRAQDAGNVTFRTPVLLLITGDHDDPTGCRLDRSPPPPLTITTR